MTKKGDIKGLYIPIITPMKKGKVDLTSMGRLMDFVDPFIDGFAPCLSSGEGDVLNDEQWQEVVSFVKSKTTKPIFVGIKRGSIEDVLRLANAAKEIGCEGLTIPVPSNDIDETKRFFEKITSNVDLPIIIYNTETKNIKTLRDLKVVDENERIVAIKDSSMNKGFFESVCSARVSGGLKMNALQGLEHLLDTPEGCDGYLVSLLNVEPKLTKQYFLERGEKEHQEIMDKFYEYNLGGEWFVTLKALLYARGLISSAEQVKQEIKI
ncbi:dihydrodipicolinate synthase family protein [Candidatus Parcubacteria bacterium]|nr:dihydrodipicolinate synthase family protein [Candidatus Parcubacteria bacterium]